MTAIVMTLLGMVVGGLMASAITWGVMQEEIDRIKRGDFTSDELQNFCHNLDDNDYLDFCDGCTAHQRKLFGGRSREDELAEQAKKDRRGAADLINTIRELRTEFKRESAMGVHCDDTENQRLRAWLLYIQDDNKNAVTNGFAVASQIDAALEGRPAPKVDDPWPNVVRGYGRAYS